MEHAVVDAASEVTIGGRSGPFQLSSELTELQADYDVVIVGSGYGGAIMASRLARAGQRVCVVERGKELWPGAFPRSLRDARHHLQLRSRNWHAGKSSALFDFRLFAGESVLVGSGLGGTSLINANVAARAADDVFDDRWPKTLRDPRVLDPYYALAESWLGSNDYPSDRPLPPKAAALRSGATRLDVPFDTPPINVTFGRVENPAGVEQPPCTLCGDCCSGCNVGAKNSVLYNYLFDVWNHGAEIYTELEVMNLRQRAGKWLVEIDPSAQKRQLFGGPPLLVQADLVVLAAGTLGSTEILLRARRGGLALSARLGDRFNGNGDVLAFGVSTTNAVDGVGWGDRTEPYVVGPTIVGRLTLPGDQGDPINIEEGAIPGLLAPVVSVATAALSFGGGGVLRAAAGLGNIVRALGGARRHTMTYLGMSRDDGDGRLELGPDGLDVVWPAVAREPVIAKVNSAMSQANAAIGGRFVANPLWRRRSNPTLVTVHPLGGCVMADDAVDGVVDHQGRVFDGTSGHAVHAGLYVVDGSVIPRPLDVNPLLTISALAERSADLLASEKHWVSDPSDHPSSLSVPPAPSSAARLEMTERMSGWLTESSELTLAPAWSGRPERSSRIELVVTIVIDDLDALLADASHPERLVGTVVVPALSDEPLMISRGTFHLFEPVPDQVETCHMHYEMELVSVDGRRFHFDGVKVIRDALPWEAWRQTTTLYVTVQEVGGDYVGRGVMRISPDDFLREMRASRVIAPGGLLARQSYLLQFQRMFLNRLYHVFGGVAAELDRFVDPATRAGSQRQPVLPEPVVQWYDPDGWHDGGDVGANAFLKLTRYQGGSKGPVLLAPGFGMSARSFTTTSVPESLAEYLCRHDYDVWLFDYRSSTDLPSHRTEFSLDPIATIDWPTAVDRVIEQSGAEDVQVVGHCVGSASLLMSLGAGLTGVRSAVCSQFTLHPMTSRFNHVKSRLGIAKLAHAVGLSGLAPDERPRLASVAEDLLLKIAPMPRHERCGQAMCRWINAIYGCTHYHEQLSDATHRDLNDLFGFANVTTLEHFSTIMNRELAVDADGQDVYTTHPERFAIPLHFVSGAHNYIFHPEGVRRTVEWLSGNNDPALYTASWLEDYGHLDCFLGRTAAHDVFPAIVEHLDRTND